MYLLLLLYYFLQFNSANFTYKNTYNVSVGDLKEISFLLQSEFDKYKEKWDIKSNPKIEIVFFKSTYDFIHYTNENRKIGGVYKNKKIFLQPINILKQKNILFSILKHELLHALFDNIENKKIPRWFNEGYAIYYSGELKRIKKNYPLKFNSLLELESKIKSNNYKEIQTAYFYLGLVIQFLSNKYGDELLNDIIRDNSNYPFEKMLETHLYTSFDTLEKEIIKYLKNF